MDDPDRTGISSSLRTLIPSDRAWIIVPAVSFGGILLAIGMPESILSLTGVIGCVLASFLLAILAYRKPRKDIVSLLTPLYAVLIFSNSALWHELIILLLYAVSLTVLVFRLNARFSHAKDESKWVTSEYPEEETEDEKIPE